MTNRLIVLDIDVMGETVTVQAQAENPYDEGYLINRTDAATLLDVWRNHPTDAEWVREVEFLEGWGFVTALYGEGVINIGQWESTTECHSWVTGDQVEEEGGEQAFSTGMWPFDFKVVERNG